MERHYSENDFSYDETHCPGSSVAVKECANCHTSEGFIDTIQTDGLRLDLCEECAQETRRLEQQADELAILPCCGERALIVERATSTANLVNRLVAHDMACHCTRPQKIEPMQAVLYPIAEVA